ncbi:MAG TPA: YceI family protein [Streptosporangiaceae bacterium]|jgi:polyisoprenoid-binding protein YceI|nr:YceI family protein [Streptosporangiaceae bacterium]
MAPSGQLTSPAVEELLRGGTLAGSWTLDPARSEVRLKTRHTWGLLPLTAVFSQVSGSGTVTADGEASGVITVGAASLNTKNKQRDQHLRSAAFFDVANHPDLTFAVDSVHPAAGGAQIDGRLTVRDQTRPASFDATVSADGDEVTLDGALQVNRGDFGLTWNFTGIASMHNTIVIHAVFTRAA